MLQIKTVIKPLKEVYIILDLIDFESRINKKNVYYYPNMFTWIPLMVKYWQLKCSTLLRLINKDDTMPKMAV